MAAFDQRIPDEFFLTVLSQSLIQYFLIQTLVRIRQKISIGVFLAIHYVSWFANALYRCKYRNKLRSRVSQHRFGSVGSYFQLNVFEMPASESE